MLSATLIRTAQLPSGEAVPVLGQGTWGLAEGKHERDQEIRALRLGLELGMSLIDTAEMYANGETEKLVGEAIHGHRDETFLVSKVLPQNASRTATIAACERSLRRLKTPWLDLYLLHWRGSIPLRETVEGLETLLQVGKIRYWGVSNFDVDDMEELVDLPHGNHVAANQVLYNLTRRGIEYDLMPWCSNRKIPIMAYSPVEQGRLLKNRELQRVADRLNARPAQVALAWVLRQAGIIAIPRAGTLEHVREDRAALELHLTEEDMKALDGAFPPPSRKQPLEML
ncbi:MAG TPA: aldo/keto reductase [Terriglobales bacterium]|jgi:diketogulonate reductase-like aldo/keto reductase|nr:aldo/keto reductase [Terriglobales bacterium]